MLRQNALITKLLLVETTGHEWFHETDIPMTCPFLDLGAFSIYGKARCFVTERRHYMSVDEYPCLTWHDTCEALGVSYWILCCCLEISMIPHFHIYVCRLTVLCPDNISNVIQQDCSRDVFLRVLTRGTNNMFMRMICGIPDLGWKFDKQYVPQIVHALSV